MLLVSSSFFYFHLFFILLFFICCFFFFFNDTATTEIYTLSLHDALPISGRQFWPATKTSIGRPILAAAVTALRVAGLRVALSCSARMRVVMGSPLLPGGASARARSRSRPWPRPCASAARPP